jgi:hypothetical protein
LAVQEELAKLARSERCTDQTFVVHVLVYRENCYRAVSGVGKRHVRRIGRASSSGVVDVVCVDYNLLNLAVLTKVVKTLQRAFRCNFWR